MPASRNDIEREIEINGSDTERAVGVLRRAIADFRDIERELRAAEARAGYETGSAIPLVKRLARLS